MRKQRSKPLMPTSRPFNPYAPASLEPPKCPSLFRAIRRQRQSQLSLKPRPPWPARQGSPGTLLRACWIEEPQASTLPTQGDGREFARQIAASARPQSWDFKVEYLNNGDIGGIGRLPARKPRHDHFRRHQQVRWPGGLPLQWRHANGVVGFEFATHAPHLAEDPCQPTPSPGCGGTRSTSCAG